MPDNDLFCYCCKEWFPVEDCRTEADEVKVCPECGTLLEDE